MTRIAVISTSFSTNTREPDLDDKWDRGSTDSDRSIHGIRIVKNDKDYHEFETCFDVVKGEEYYLLYGVYTTGDSFGSDSGNVQYVDLYKTVDAAKLNRDRLRDHYDNHDKKSAAYEIDKFSTNLTNENGESYLFHVPWTGYFEHLEGLEIEPVRVLD